MLAREARNERVTGAISARDRSILALLTGCSRFEVPGYQRPYGWSLDSVDRLLDDLIDAMARGEETPGSGYFLGSVVLSRQAGGTALDIVDGQQRLVSLTILLAVLRDLGLADPVLGAAVGSAVLTESGAPRLVPRIADADFLLRHVQAPGATTQFPAWWVREAPHASGDLAEPGASEDGDDEDAFLGRPDAAPVPADEPVVGDGDQGAEVANGLATVVEAAAGDDTGAVPPTTQAPLADSQRAMLAAREQLRARLAVLPAEGAQGRGALARFVLERSVVVAIEVGDPESSYRVFSVLNTRGERLSETDILKAEILGAIGEPRTRRACQAIWEECEAELGRDELENLFSHVRMIGLKRRPRRSVVEEIRQHFAPLAEPEAFVDNVMQPLAAILGQIIAGNLVVAGADAATQGLIGRYLTYLSWLPNTSWRPAVLAFIHRHGDNGPAILRFLKAVDRLAYGMLILKRDEGERIAKYRHVLEAIEVDRNLFSARASALRLDRRAREVILSRLSGGYFGIQSFASVVLRRLDAELVRGPLPDYEDTTVEHVLPRNPERRSQWMRWFPGDDADPTRGVTENCQRLGNLILLPEAENLAAANRSPADKWTAYFAAPGAARLGLKEQIREHKSWTPRTLDAIHTRRIARLAHVWGLVPERAEAEAPAAVSEDGAGASPG